jgi:hypothetical protein
MIVLICISHKESDSGNILKLPHMNFPLVEGSSLQRRAFLLSLWYQCTEGT